MKPVSNLSVSRPTHRAKFRLAWPARRMTVAGFTLLEMMIAVGIFTVLIAGMIGTQLFGLRVYTLASTKLIATTNGRQSLNTMRDQIRSAQQVYVGIFDPVAQTFTRIPDGSAQVGNALQLFTVPLGMATNYFTIFYQDPTTNMVFSITNNPLTSSLLDGQTVLAKYMTNYYCFDAEDYRYPPTIVSNYVNNPVIGVTMDFYKWEYPVGYVISSGATNAVDAYDYYYLRTHITRRCGQ
jgi:prepilin-type N-terminal cleavage/methylation domain-containing protein